MSRIAQDWVSSSGLVGNKRFVLRELAECHNQGTGRCDPAIKKDRSEPTGRSVNELTGIGEAKLSKLLDELEADGRLIRERRHWKKNGWRASDQFHLAIPGFEKVWVDERMANAKARTVTLGANGSKALVRTVPKREFGASLSVTRAAAYQEGRTRKEETTTTSTVSGSSYGADKKTSTSTTDGAGAVEEEPFDNHVSQGNNHEQVPQSLVAELETPWPSDEAGIDGSSKEEVVPAEVQALVARFSGLERHDIIAKWRWHLGEAVSEDAMGALEKYCKLCTGTALSHKLKSYEAAAKALPPRQRTGRERVLEAVA